MVDSLGIDESDPEFRALAYLNRLPFKLIDGGRRLIDVTSFEGLPLWWIVRPYVSRDFLLIVRKIAASRGGETQDGFHLAAWPFKAASDRWLSAKLGLTDLRPTRWGRGVYTAKALAGRKLLRAFYDHYVPAKWKIRRWVGDPSDILSKKQARQRRVLALSHSRLWGELGWGRQGDLVLEPVLEQLRRRGWEVFGAEVDYDERGETATLRKRRFHGQWFSFEAFADGNVHRRYRYAQARFCREFERLKRKGFLQETFRFGGVDIFPLVEARVELVFTSLLPHAVRMVEMARNMLKATKPDVVLMAYETGPAGRAVSAAAREIGVPTVAVQHGRIHPLHHHYAQCLGLTEGCPNARSRLLPDVTAVYGEGVAEVLFRYGGYTPGDVAVTGQPRSDLIVQGTSRLDRATFLEKVGADPKLPTVLLATQNFPDLGDRLRVLQVVFGRKPGDWQVLVKTHPGERDGLVDRFLRERAVKRAFVLRRAELYSCLAAADVVVTGTSTVGMEALLFSKPLITVGGLPSPLDLPWVGAAVEVNTPDEFQEAVNRILGDRAFRESLLTRAREYVHWHFNGVDGQASARVAELIEAQARGDE